ncbi:RNA polymerase sigma factor [Nocardioides sp.]|uniref:RNA polymerase sigma factor n=1 Tax=Nocardioides sp. TaxID=35761 RepID=UPI003D0ABA59
MTTTSQEDLLRRSRQGDLRALHRLIDAHRTQLRAFCARFRDDPDDRQELAQLVMIRVWRGIGGFDGRSSFSTWLFQIVRNTAASEHTRLARVPQPVDLHTDGGALLVPAAGPSLEDVVVLRDEIDRALVEVAPPFRRVLELVDVWGCPQAEVAALCAVAEPTVRTRLWRGRRALREALRPEAA